MILELYSNPLKKNNLLISLALVLASSLFLAPDAVSRVHAQFTGKVCITDTTTATGCAASPPSLGPFSVGQNFTVGVFVQGSDAMAGFEIYVKSDPAIVNPVSAALGSLISHPALSDMCIDNVSFTPHQCSPGGVNGPGVVQVGATEITGTNECGGVSPCSGMAFTITYKVVGQATQTGLFYPTAASCSTTSVFSQPNTCVLIVNALRWTLPEGIQGATVAQTRFTGLVCVTFPSTAIGCSATPPSIGPLSVGSSFTVGIFVQGSDAMGGFDIYVRSDPTIVNPTSAAVGSLIVNPSFTSICVNGVSQTGACTVGTVNGPGVVEVTTIESTGANECGSISPCSGLAFTITYRVVGSTPSTSLSYPIAASCSTSSVASPPNTCVFVDDALGTVLPERIQGATVFTVPDFNLTAAASSLSIPAGSSASDTLTVTGIGGFTGMVSLTKSSVPSGVAVVFVPDPVVITSPGVSAKSSMTVFVGSLAGTSFNITVIATAGSITHTLVVSVMVTRAPSLTGGELHWTHHVSLSKTNGTQTWTANVANPLSTSVKVLVRIVGSSSLNPSLTFDVTCGVTCVNTAGGVNTTPGLTPVSVIPGAKSFSFSFSQAVGGIFINTKLMFTATLYWTTGTVYNSSSSRSGSFAILP